MPWPVAMTERVQSSGESSAISSGRSGRGEPHVFCGPGPNKRIMHGFDIKGRAQIQEISVYLW